MSHSDTFDVKKETKELLKKTASAFFFVVALTALFQNCGRSITLVPVAGTGVFQSESQFPTTTLPSVTTTTHQNSGAGYCSHGADYGPKCKEGNCFCFMSLSKALSRKPVDMAKVNNYAGGSDARNVFLGGGSENIPVTCRAVKYLIEGDPAWFTRYFDVQFDDPTIGLFGSELFSNTYASLTVGNVITVRKEAARRGHAALEQKATRWLKAYWSLLTLMAHTDRINTIQTHMHDEATGRDLFNTSGMGNWADGYSLVLPGNRAYVNKRGGGVGLQDTMLSMALNHPERRFSTSLNHSPGFYGGLCATVKSLGYTMDQQGFVNLKSNNPPASDFGLTEAERNELRAFIASNGQSGLSSIVQTLSPYKLRCDLTIIRTTAGITAWFGNETGQVGLCSRVKGGSFVATTFLSAERRALYLSRAKRQNHPEAATIWKQGESICESSSLPTKCIEIVGGSTIFKIRWPKFTRINAL